MNVWLIILLQILPLLLEWLEKLLKRKGKLKPREMERLNEVLWYTARVDRVAVKAGCQHGGVSPKEDS
mgnify:CR=1 FL=1